LAVPEEMVIPVTQVKLNLLDIPGPTKAIGSVTLGGSFMVHGVRVVQGPQGLFVGMPQRKDGDQYRDLAHPVTGDLRRRLDAAVLEEYQKLREREGPERSR
jgi:stage V sporulation protein G